MNNFIKNKKLIGTLALLLIVIISTIIIYQKQGNKKLNKNDTEEIFVSEDEEDTETISESNKDKNVNDSEDSNKKATNTIKSNKKTENQKIVVEIKGEVNNPDVYTLDKNSIVKDLIDMAGGLTSDADLGNINRAKQLTDHELIYIGNKNEQANSLENSNNSSNSTSNTGSSNSSSNNDLININTASLDELKKINGVGDAKAKTIIEYREQNGSFNSIEDIKNVSGIGEKMFEKIKQQITT